MADYPNAITPPRTFFSIPRLETFEQLKQVDVAFLGVPFDAGASAPWTMAGQSAAPNAIRDVNPTLFHDISTVGLYDVDEGRTLLRGLKMMDCGDVNFAPGDSRINFQRIEAAAREIINQGTMLVGVGGDHSITYPLIRALDHYQDGEIDIINLDAHFDFFPDSMGSQIAHGTWCYHANQLGHIGHIYNLGARVTIEEEVAAINAAGIGWATSREIMREGGAEVVKRLVRPGRKVYVTIDIDGLDGKEVPGTTKPEPGGFDFNAAIDMLKQIAKQNEVVGFDIVELNPHRDLHNMTANTCAQLMLNFIGNIFAEKQS